MSLRSKFYRYQTSVIHGCYTTYYSDTSYIIEVRKLKKPNLAKLPLIMTTQKEWEQKVRNVFEKIKSHKPMYSMNVNGVEVHITIF